MPTSSRTIFQIQEWVGSLSLELFVSLVSLMFLGMLPELKVDNRFVLSQSHTIARFLAAQFG